MAQKAPNSAFSRIHSVFRSPIEQTMPYLDSQKLEALQRMYTFLAWCPNISGMSWVEFMGRIVTLSFTELSPSLWTRTKSPSGAASKTRSDKHLGHKT